MWMLLNLLLYSDVSETEVRITAVVSMFSSLNANTIVISLHLERISFYSVVVCTLLKLY